MLIDLGCSSPSEFPRWNKGQILRASIQERITAYKLLRNMQAKSIPKYLGHFTIKFYERELDDDRIFNLLMMEQNDFSQQNANLLRILRWNLHGRFMKLESSSAASISISSCISKATVKYGCSVLQTRSIPLRPVSRAKRKSIKLVEWLLDCDQGLKSRRDVYERGY